MAQYYSQQYPQNPNPQAAQNLQFYPSSYSTGPVSGHSTPFQAGYGSPPPSSVPAYPSYGGGAAASFGAPPVSGRMGEQGGLRTGWIAAFGTEGYDGEPPLLEELGVNFDHIRTKVCNYEQPALSHHPEDCGFRSVADIKLTDAHRPEPAYYAFPTHHGRQRSVRRSHLPHSLRNLPCVIRQIFLWIHIRHCSLRFRWATYYLLSYDSASRPNRITGAGPRSARSRLRWFWRSRRSILKHINVLA
jgi:hypothetical protein